MNDFSMSLDCDKGFCHSGFVIGNYNEKDFISLNSKKNVEGSFSDITLYSSGSINVVGAESRGGTLNGTYNATGIYNHSDTVTNQTIGTINNGSSITATRTGIQNNAESGDATITTLTNNGTTNQPAKQTRLV